MDQPLGLRLVAEALGTFLFFFLGFSGIAVLVDVGPEAITSLGIAAGFGFGLTLAITAFGHLTGGHFNPAVSAGLAIAGKFPARDVLPYWVAQLVGGFGAVLVMGIVHRARSWTRSTRSREAASTTGPRSCSRSSRPRFVMDPHRRQRRPGRVEGRDGPFLIGLFIFTAAATVGSSGGSYNPARSLDPGALEPGVERRLDLHQRAPRRRCARRREGPTSSVAGSCLGLTRADEHERTRGAPQAPSPL